MWSTLKKIVEAELADSTSQAADSVTLRFLSLAPRVARLNQAVRAGLEASSSAEADTDTDVLANAVAGTAADCTAGARSSGNRKLR